MMLLEEGRLRENSHVALGPNILAYYQPPPESWLFPLPGPPVLGTQCSCSLLHLPLCMSSVELAQKKDSPSVYDKGGNGVLS